MFAAVGFRCRQRAPPAHTSGRALSGVAFQAVCARCMLAAMRTRSGLVHPVQAQYVQRRSCWGAGGYWEFTWRSFCGNVRNPFA